MKILYCIPNLCCGGAERQLSYIAAELAARGHEIHVASSRGGPNLDRLKSSSVQWHSLGGFSNRDPLIFLRLITLIRRLKPDVLQTILAPMDIMGGAAALLTRTRWVLKESSSGSLYTFNLRNGLRALLGRLADIVVSNSAGGDEYWRSAGARVRHKIPNSVPLDEIDLAVSIRPSEQPWLARGRKTILFAGRFDAGKNLETLITALAKIADETPFVALLCGDGARRPELERMVAKLGLAQRILFPGYVSNLWSLMKGADAFIFLSRCEGCPNVVLEAAACGAPLIVSDIAAHRELLDESSALFVDPNDAAAAAAALKETLECESAADKRAQGARARIVEMTIEETVRLYERLYL